VKEPLVRRLTLRTETLTDLTATELSGVAAGASHLCPTDQATLCHLCALTPPVLTVTDRVTEQTCTW
jgi:hypothetical protein